MKVNSAGLVNAFAFGGAALWAGAVLAQPPSQSPVATFLKANPDILFTNLKIADVRGRCPLIVETGGVGDHWDKTIDWSRIESIKIYPNNPGTVVLHGPLFVERTVDKSGRGDQTNGTVFHGTNAQMAQLLKLLKESRLECGGKAGRDE